jgi:hypothetical protein
MKIYIFKLNNRCCAIRNSFENFVKDTSRNYQTYTKNEKNAVVHMYSLELNWQKKQLKIIIKLCDRWKSYQCTNNPVHICPT